MLSRCEKCGKFFGAEKAEKICSACKEGEFTGLGHINDPREQKFVVARNIVYEKPNISPEELVLEMQSRGITIDIRQVMEYVKKGRLRLSAAAVEGVCEDCGKKILSGRKCPACTKKFEQVIKGEKAKKPEQVEIKKTGVEMHTKS